MQTTIEETKARLEELVDRASRGEEIVIEVDGRSKARLTGLDAPPMQSVPRDKEAWMSEIEKQAANATTRVSRSSESIFDEIRADRF